MGIRGFLTYVRNHPDLLQPYKLQGEYLVMDGDSVAARLMEYQGPSMVLGGDYSSYAHRAAKFFDELKKLNVTPLVILSGRHDEIDFDRICYRKQLQLEAMDAYSPASRDQSSFEPIAKMIVFKSILKKKGINVVRCISNMEPKCAAVAVALDCAVLTFNSNFYLYGIKIIIIDSLCASFIDEPKSTSFGDCKLFSPLNLTKVFSHSLESTLPLVYMLLDNMSGHKKFFDGFYARLATTDNWPRTSSRLYSFEQRKIEATLRWLNDCTLHDAIAEILRFVLKNKRKRILNTIKKVLNDHFNLSFDLLRSFGLKTEYKTAVAIRNQCAKLYGICLYNEIRLWESESMLWQSDDTRSENSSSDKDEARSHKLFNELGELNEEIVASWPPWFTQCFDTAEVPWYFIDLQFHRFFNVPVRPENLEYPSYMEASIKILRVIDGILVAGNEKLSSVGLTYLTRKGRTFASRYVETLKSTKTTRLPTLAELPKTSVRVKKRIINDTLGISSVKAQFQDVPSQWRLYVAAIVFWSMQRDVGPPPDKFHIQAVLFAMLFGVVDKQIGYQRSLEDLKKISKKSKKKTLSRRFAEVKIKEERIVSIDDALKKVTNNDCLTAAPVFIENHHMDPRLETNSKYYNVAIVHAFMQFQSCISFACDLNKLLGCPYDPPAIEELYNGTMMYNLYDKYVQDRNVEDCITSILSSTPSLHSLLNRLIEKVQEIIDATKTV